MISRIIKLQDAVRATCTCNRYCLEAEADNTCRDLDHSGYHQKWNSIIVIIYIVAEN